MKALFYKRNNILILEILYFILGLSLLVVLGSSVNYLTKAPFDYWGDFYEFMLILGISLPSVLMMLISWGLFAYSKKNLFFAFVSSVVCAMWYFILSLILLYIRFASVGKCGFQGYRQSENEASYQCGERLIQMNEITVLFAIAFVLFVLLWYTILQIIKSREEIRLISKKSSARQATA